MTKNPININTNRRQFLKVGAIATSGLVISFQLPSNVKDEQGNKSADEGAVSFNAYLTIHPDGTATIASPNPECGQGIKTSFPMIVAEELDMDWKKIKVVQAPLDTTRFERQVAGGSRSTPHSWKRLREAGATAKYLLLQAAAKSWSVPVTELTANKGIIRHEASNKFAHYGTFAEAASKLEAPKEIKLKNVSEFKLIGTFQSSVDNNEVFTGKAIYGIDYKVPGMLNAMIVRPPFGTKLKAANADTIKSMPGIVDVVMMANNKIAIVGKTTWEIMKARKNFNPEYEATKELENSGFHDQKLNELLNGKMDVKKNEGNVADAFKSAHKIIEAEFQCPFIPHSSMEPMNFFAHVSGDKCVLAGPSQNPESARNGVAKLLNIPVENISLELTKLGGGFGRRLNSDFALEAAELSKIIQQPVKVTWSREDDMTAGIYRPACKYKFKAGIDAKGNMTAFHLKAAGLNSGNPARENNFPLGAIPNFLVEAADFKSDVTTGPWRAPITNFLAGSEAVFFDEVAEAGGKDPLTLRLEWVAAAKANTAAKHSYDPDRFKAVIDLIAEKSQWFKKKKGVYKGFSVYFAHSTYVAQVAEVVKVKGKPVLKKVYCAVDCGILVNQSGAKNQIVGSIVDGIGHAMYARLSFKDGMSEQNNFDGYRLIRFNEIPTDVEVHFVKNNIDPTGLGEPALPPISGAVSNAYYRATGIRMRNQPYIDYFDAPKVNTGRKVETQP